MVTIKSQQEIELLRKGGALLAGVLDRVRQKATAGTPIKHLDSLAEQLIRESGGEPAFLGYRGDRRTPPYPSTLCVSINDEVVHGIGTRETILKDGDLVGLDIGMRYPAKNGLFTDMAVTVSAGKVLPEALQLIETTKKALNNAIAAVRPGAKTTDLSKIIQETVERAGFSPVRSLTGHGVGYKLHEDPPIFCYYRRGMPETVLQEGMVIAIEPMVCQGSWEVAVDPDHWTIRTADGKLSAHFEHTIAVTKDGYEVLTRFEPLTANLIMRYLGVDYGDAHIGIAIGDDETRMALPLETITNEGVQKIIEYFATVIAREGIDVIVVGVPAMGVHYGEQRASIEAVIKKIQESLSIPVHASDESFSSRQARTLMRDRGPAPTSDEHAIAAMLILQGYFEKRA